MTDHTRDGKIVINLTGSWHDPGDPSLLTTTRNYFTRDDFLAVRAGIQKLQGTREGAEALARMRAGESLSAAQKDLLKTNLGSFAENRQAIKGVSGWVKEHGIEIPEAVLRQGEHAVFPEQISAAATALSTRVGAEKAGSVLNIMRDIAGGKAVSDTARKEAMKAFEDAGLLTGKGELTSVGVLMLKPEGAKFLAQAGIMTAEGARAASQAFAAVARTPAEAAEASKLAGAGERLAAGEKVTADATAATRIGAETAEAAGLGSRVVGTVMRKIPLAGEVIAAGTAIVGIADAAHAETLPPEPQGAPQTPEEKKARELLEMQAQMQKNTDVAKEVVKGALSLLPIPGADIAFEKYADNQEAEMQARADAATAAKRPVEVNGLVQQPSTLDGGAPISAYYNAQARGPTDGSPTQAADPAPKVVVPQQKPAAAAAP